MLKKLNFKYKEILWWLILGLFYILCYLISTYDNTYFMFIALSIISIVCLFNIYNNIKVLLENIVLTTIFSLISVLFLPYNYFSNKDNKIVFYILLAISGFLFMLISISNLIYLLKNKKYINTEPLSPINSISFFIIPLFSLLYTWISNYPALLSPDSLNQLNQIKTNDFNDVHPATHTLFCKLLMQIHDSPATVVFLQIISLSICIGYIFFFMYKKGISHRLLLPLLIFWSSLYSIRIVTCYLWKDIFFAVGLLLATIILIISIEKKKNISILQIILGGISLTVVMLFRHNGVVTYLFLVFIFIYFIYKFKSIKYIVPIIISLSLIFFIKIYIFDSFNVKPNNNGTKLAFIGKSIISVVAYDGNYTTDELNKIDILMPKEIIKKQYDRTIGQNLLWVDYFEKSDYKYSFTNTLVGKDKFIIDLFFELLPKNFLIMTWDMVGSASLMIVFYTNFLLHNMLYMYILIIALSLCYRKKCGLRVIPFIPVFANIFSLIISNISFEWRYAYPTLVLFPVLLIYTYYAINTYDKNQYPYQAF